MVFLRIDSAPPSVNAVWRSVGDRVLRSKEYRAWASAAGWQLKTQEGIAPDQYWSVRIVLPGKTKADLDNLSKGILDALHASGKTPDDRYLVKMETSFWSGDHVGIWVCEERPDVWGQIKGASRTLVKKLTPKRSDTE